MRRNTTKKNGMGYTDDSVLITWLYVTSVQSIKSTHVTNAFACSVELNNFVVASQRSKFKKNGVNSSLHKFCRFIRNGISFWKSSICFFFCRDHCCCCIYSWLLLHTYSSYRAFCCHYQQQHKHQQRETNEHAPKTFTFFLCEWFLRRRLLILNV